MAETVGFEPTDRLITDQTISRGVKRLKSLISPHKSV